MVDEVSQQVIRVYTDTAPRTAKELFHLLSVAAKAEGFLRNRLFTNQNNDLQIPVTGEQSIEKLNLQGKPLEKIVFRDDKLETLRNALSEYGVDYTVLPSAEKEGVEVWFKSQDLNRIESAVQYVKNELMEELSGPANPSLDERLEEAHQKATEHNASIPNIPTPEKAHKKELVL
jgi:hypothetical protein